MLPSSNTLLREEDNHNLFHVHDNYILDPFNILIFKFEIVGVMA